ncbi:MAG: ATP-binding protein [Deltaproteobacteria bacterium]|nr:ATP-binding protein [Deltaproteobacteria bacterium]
MDVKSFNELLAQGEIDREDMWPHLAEMKSRVVQFRFEFGLEELPLEPGLITIRGPRQYGKSTWLEMHLKKSIQDYGRGSAFYLNGDELASPEDLVREIENLEASYSPDAKVKRLFIDEITAVTGWERGIKRVIDQGLLRNILVITTGSKASDLRRGSEKLPGRKGRLKKSEFLFLPISYREFHRLCGHKLGEKSWIAYLLTGGSPLACNDIYESEHLPEYFIQLIRDWVMGEVVASGRSRVALTQILPILFRGGGQPIGYAKLARESGLANNTVASGYLEQLSDLLAVLPAWPWDTNAGILQIRKRCKFHFINLAVAIAFHPAALRSIDQFETLTTEMQGMFMEWLVAQEVWRRSVLAGADNPEAIGFWGSKDHEIDFVTPNHELIEVKRGRAGPLDFSWFSKSFPHGHLAVICGTPFQTSHVTGMTLEQFLLAGG